MSENFLRVRVYVRMCVHGCIYMCVRRCVRLDVCASVGLRAYERGRICANIAGILKYPRNIEISSESLNIGRIFKYHPMVLGELGGMGVGSNARKREKCQAGQCLIRVDGNWNEIGNSWKADGKKLEKVGKDWRS